MKDPKDDDPIQAYEEEKQKVAAARHAEDFNLWKTWVDSGKKPVHLEPLVQRFEPILEYKAQQWNAPNVDPAALRGELKSQLVRAFHAYKPDKGAQLRTFVDNRFRKGLRFVQKNQNMAFMGEGRTSLVGPVQRAHDALMGNLGRVPTAEEIAEHMQFLPNAPKYIQSVTPTKIRQVQDQNLKDVGGSAFLSDPAAQVPSRHQEVMSLLPYSLTPDEKDVLELMEQKGLSPGRVAKALNKSPSEISRIRSAINKKYKSYL